MESAFSDKEQLTAATGNAVDKLKARKTHPETEASVARLESFDSLNMAADAVREPSTSQNTSRLSEATFVAVPRAFESSVREEWQNQKGTDYDTPLLPYGEKRTGDGDFGPVQVVQNSNGKLEFHHASSVSPDVAYHFVETHRNLTHTYFKCCMEVATQRQLSDLRSVVKSVGVLNGRLLHDPERPKDKRHICEQAHGRMPSTARCSGGGGQHAHAASFSAGSTLPSTFGVARYEDETKAVLLYESRRYPGKTHRFLRTNRYVNRTYYDCSACRNVRDMMKLSQRLPSVIVLSHNGTDTIMSHDPDFPACQNGHLCLAGTLPSTHSTQSEQLAAPEMNAEYKVVSDVCFHRDEHQLCRRLTIAFCETTAKAFSSIDFGATLYAIVASKMRQDSAKGHIHCSVALCNKASGEQLFRLPHVYYWLVRKHHFGARAFSSPRRFQSRCFVDSFELSMDYFKLMDDSKETKASVYEVVSAAKQTISDVQGTLLLHETRFTLTKRLRAHSLTDHLHEALRDITEKTLVYAEKDLVKLTLEDRKAGVGHSVHFKDMSELADADLHCLALIFAGDQHSSLRRTLCLTLAVFQKSQ